MAVTGDETESGTASVFGSASVSGRALRSISTLSLLFIKHGGTELSRMNNVTGEQQEVQSVGHPLGLTQLLLVVAWNLRVN